MASKLRQIHLPGEHFMFGEHIPEQVRTQTARHEGADEHIRVEEHLHDTIAKTSSPVMMPSASARGSSPRRICSNFANAS